VEEILKRIRKNVYEFEKKIYKLERVMQMHRDCHGGFGICDVNIKKIKLPKEIKGIVKKLNHKTINVYPTPFLEYTFLLVE